MQGQIEKMLVCCKNYDAIINFHYPNYDYISEKLIGAYQEYLFQVDQNDPKAIHIATQLDQVMYAYVESRNFYRYVQNYYSKDDSISFGDLTDVIALYHDYIQFELRKEKETKWI